MSSLSEQATLPAPSGMRAASLIDRFQQQLDRFSRDIEEYAVKLAPITGQPTSDLTSAPQEASESVLHQVLLDLQNRLSSLEELLSRITL